MSKTVRRASAPKNEYSSEIESEHFVQFYTYDHVLINSLEQYIAAGLKQGEICIVIATARHRKELEARLKDKDIDLAAARQNGQFICLDAVDTLSGIINDGAINQELFFKQFSTVASKAAKNNRPIRVFGEMIALLWKKHDTEGVIKLEKLWNELSDKYTFSHYCAYPMMYFIREIHQDVMNEISQCHSFVASQQM